MELENGARVGVVGGGPAGSLFSYFLLEFADRIDTELTVDIWEPKDFAALGPGGCNHCGGIISESLVQMLATEGLNLPSSVVQRGISSYTLHTDLGTVHLETPGHEKRIAAVHRGGGPRGGSGSTFGSFDGFLLDTAAEKGARVIRKRVTGLRWEDDRPVIECKGSEPQVYDLLIGATGINSAAIKLFEGLGFGFEQPGGSKTYISELHLGAEQVERCLGDSMHVFLLDLPKIEFAAMIPKGDYATLCILGDGIDAETVQNFLSLPEVRECLPHDWNAANPCCYCMPKINVKAGKNVFSDRVALIGDAGVSRLYKDGIGASYRTAKACATAAVFGGIDRRSFQRGYAHALKMLDHDNKIGVLVFTTVDLFKKFGFLRRGMLRMVEQEQSSESRPMSTVLWDSFTGSAPYEEIFLRACSPAFLARLGWESFMGLFEGAPRKGESTA